jgi:hypothetical protein
MITDQAKNEFHTLYTEWYNKWNDKMDIDIIISAFIEDTRSDSQFQYCNVEDKRLLDIHFEEIRKISESYRIDQWED